MDRILWFALVCLHQALAPCVTCSDAAPVVREGVLFLCPFSNTLREMLIVFQSCARWSGLRSGIYLMLRWRAVVRVDGRVMDSLGRGPRMDAESGGGLGEGRATRRMEACPDPRGLLIQKDQQQELCRLFDGKKVKQMRMSAPLMKILEEERVRMAKIYHKYEGVGKVMVDVDGEVDEKCKISMTLRRGSLRRWRNRRRLQGNWKRFRKAIGTWRRSTTRSRRRRSCDLCLELWCRGLC